MNDVTNWNQDTLMFPSQPTLSVLLLLFFFPVTAAHTAWGVWVYCWVKLGFGSEVFRGWREEILNDGLSHTPLVSTAASLIDWGIC
jgi:hypothetical protein